MKTALRAILMLGMAMMLTACLLNTPDANLQQEGKPTMSGETNSVSTNVDALGQLIQLTNQPQRVLWKVTQYGDSDTSRVPGPNSFRLEAVLTFKPDDLRTIQTQAVSFIVDQTVEWEESDFEDWYPTSVRESFTQNSANKYRLTQPLYDAAALFGKSPYTSGHFIITNAGDIFISMSTD